MHQIRARNVNDAYVQASQLITCHGQPEMTRNGLALVVQEPVTTHYEFPLERVLFNASRDANPFFHVFESLWMLSGRNDVEWLSKFNSNISNYSDDGRRFHGAYGFRLRKAYGVDQLGVAVTMLKADPSSRRVYCPIYHPELDLNANSKDIPCNLGIKFEIKKTGDWSALNMMVFNRSNDIVWGAYGANVVHFSYIQEWVAMQLDVAVGWYEQISTNWHCYMNTYDRHNLKEVANNERQDPYETGDVQHAGFLGGGETAQDWDNDLREFMNEANGIHPVQEYRTEYFKHVISPMLDAWEFYKDGEKALALAAVEEIYAADWRRACNLWLMRRKWNEQN